MEQIELILWGIFGIMCIGVVGMALMMMLLISAINDLRREVLNLNNNYVRWVNYSVNKR